MHAGRERRLERFGRVVGGEIDEDRVGQSMARNERHSLARACPAAAGSLRKRCELCLGGREPREPAKRQPARVEHQSAAVDQSDDAQREPLTLDLRDHRRQRATDLAESQQHDVGTLGLR
ncbi:MAG: hypothetical protein DMD67_10450, partial [Gemmatimonadetes bacterium]